MANFDREASVQRFANFGLKTNAAPDAMPSDRSPYLRNVRNYTATELVPRAQMKRVVNPPASGPGVVQSLDAQLLIYTIGGSVYFSGSLVDSGYSLLPNSIVPFRPNASPQAYDYIFDENKFSKMTAGGTGIANIGIIEPQIPVEAAMSALNLSFQGSGGYAHGGSAGAATGINRVSYAIQNFYSDPAAPASLYSVFMGTGIQNFARFMPITIDGGVSIVVDVFQPSATVGIQSIFYFSGTTGRCVIVPNNLGLEAGGSGGSSIYGATLLNTLRRGAIVQVGSELCFVLSVTTGPTNNSIAIETSTLGPHSAAETVTGMPCISITGSALPQVGHTVLGDAFTSSVTAGIGTYTVVNSTFFSPGTTVQEYDYVHFSILSSNIELINEVKILFDVGDGSFNQNFYYYTVRPADILGGIQNNLTQLAVAQLISQRATIDEEAAAAANNQAVTTSSSQTVAGENQWSDIVFQISDLTRVGGDQAKNLQTVNRIQILVNAAGSMTFQSGGVILFGGYSPDVSATGLPIKYRARPRSSVTGARGNPSPEMRYGVSSRRGNILVTVPTSYPDPQMDTWDIFRIGGALDQYTYVGSTPLGVAGGQFNDNLDDAALQGGDVLETNLYQPFPTIDNPFSGQGTAFGTVLQITPQPGTNTTTLLNYLPGNIITVGTFGQTNYTLRKRPLWSGPFTNIVTIETVENVGAITSPTTMAIYEPLMAQSSNVSQVWGPDANGVLFGVGDSFRPGFIYKTNPNDPDSASDDAQEITPPTEPLINGCLLGGTSVVASMNRWWRGFPQQDGSYNWVEIPVGEGLISLFGIATDGNTVYFVTSHGIMKHSGGPAQSVTDKDLYNLFPHEDVFPQQPITYAGFSIFPPGYANLGNFRLHCHAGYLYFDYQDVNGNWATLVMNTATEAWCVDQYADVVTCRSSVTAPPNGLQSLMYCGTTVGSITQEELQLDIFGEVVNVVVATAEMTMGDLRAEKYIGDVVLDCIANPAINTFVMVLGQIANTIPVFGTTRQVQIITLVSGLARGGLYCRSVGLMCTWSDQGNGNTLYFWQPSYINKPEITEGRVQDWDAAGYDGNKFFQGFLLTADTFNANSPFAIRDADTLNTHDFTGPLLTPVSQINHNGQSEIAYSFVAPFRAHLVRYEPLSDSPARYFGIKWIFQPTPEFAQFWACQPTGFGIDGYKHPQRLLFPYAATAAVSLTVVVDGRASTFTLPSTAGSYAKQEIIFSPLLKGLIYSISATSAALFAVWPEDAEMLVKGWGDEGDYKRVKLIGSAMTPNAEV